MFNFNETISICEIEKIIDKKVNERLKKVRIPAEAINNAVVKFFTEKSWFLTKDGKKLDTFDLIRKFAMNTIGVAENGEINPEFLKIVREEIAKIIADESVASAVKTCKCEKCSDTDTSNDDENHSCTCDNCGCNESDDIPFTDTDDLTFDSEDIDSAWMDGVDYAITEVNKLIKKNNGKFVFDVNDDYNVLLMPPAEEELKKMKAEYEQSRKKDEDPLDKFTKSLTPDQKDLLSKIKSMFN